MIKSRIEKVQDLLRKGLQIIEESGSIVGQGVDDHLKVMNQPYLFAVTKRIIPENRSFRKLGYNPDVDDKWEEVIYSGDEYVFPDVPMSMVVSSDSANDSIHGEGVQKVRVNYLNRDHKERTLIMDLGGTTPVPTSVFDILRVNDFDIYQVGSLKTIGNISLKHLDNTPTYAFISSLLKGCYQSIYTVSADKELFIRSWKFSANADKKDSKTQIILWGTFTEDSTTGETVLLPGVFILLDIAQIKDASGEHVYDVPIKVPAMADIKVSAISDDKKANARVTSTLDGWIEDIKKE